MTIELSGCVRNDLRAVGLCEIPWRPNVPAAMAPEGLHHITAITEFAGAEYAAPDLWSACLERLPTPIASPRSGPAGPP